MTDQRWVLTDVAADRHADQFALGPADVPGTDRHAWSIRKRTLRGGLRDGVDFIEIDNGALAFSVVPTRGMSIWKGACDGNLLGWDSPVRGPVHPHFVDLHDRGGIGWIRGFDEWIVRCGLENNGAPGIDSIPDNNGNPQPTALPLHGRIANTPASHVEVRVGSGGSPVLTVAGTVEEAALFCPSMQLRTEISTAAGSRRLTIRDEVHNLRSVPTEMQLLYHCNFGRPFLGAGSRVVTPFVEAAPRDPRAAEGVDTMLDYPGPTAGFIEQCYWFVGPDLPAGKLSGAMLRNAAGDRAVLLRWDRRELPCFTLWKNPAAVCDGYVTGLEPGTNFPNTRGFERKQGRVVTLGAGQVYTVTLTVEVLLDRGEVTEAERELTALAGGVKPVVHRTPQPKFSPVG